MFRQTLLAAAALAALAGLGAGDAAAQGASPNPGAAAAMQPGQRMQLGTMMGSRRVRMVMVGENGSTIDVVYDEDNPRDRTQSQRVLRLENVNGMLEVIYDTSLPSMQVGSGGRVARVENSGNGMIEIIYGR